MNDLSPITIKSVKRLPAPSLICFHHPFKKKRGCWKLVGKHAAAPPAKNSFMSDRERERRAQPAAASHRPLWLQMYLQKANWCCHGNRITFLPTVRILLQSREEGRCKKKQKKNCITAGECLLSYIATMLSVLQCKRHRSPKSCKMGLIQSYKAG